MLTNNYLKSSFYILLSLFALTACLRDPDPLPSAWDVMSADPQYSIYLEAATIAEFDDDFQSGSSLTYFAPNNNAFEAWFDTLGVNGINDIPQADLQDLLRYHLIQGAATIGDLGTNYYLTAAAIGPEFSSVAILIESNSNGQVFINGSARVIDRDKEAQNSLIHTIDKVLKIPTTLDLLEANQEFSELAEGMRRAGLADFLDGGQAHTILAPPNAAFEANLPALYQVEKVADMEQADVDSLFRYHVMPGNITQEFILNNRDTHYDTYLPNRSLRIIDFGGGHTINDSIGFLLSNVQARNGVLHFVNNVVHYQ